MLGYMQHVLPASMLASTAGGRSFCEEVPAPEAGGLVHRC